MYLVRTMFPPSVAEWWAHGVRLGPARVLCSRGQNHMVGASDLVLDQIHSSGRNM